LILRHRALLALVFDEVAEAKEGTLMGLVGAFIDASVMANVLASVAAYETEVRAERVLAGQAAARAAGKRWGGSKKGRRLKVTDEQLAIVQRMRSEGRKIAGIARATGLSRPTIYRLIESGPG
jgi:DNA invertase Pin-like site-specific DNA recombinase